MRLKCPTICTLRRVAVVAVTFFAVPLASYADTPDERGLEIAAESDRRDSGFVDSEVSLEMTLRDESGRLGIRKLRILTFELSDGDNSDKILVFFSSPPDIEGTALLSHTRKIAADDQWLYLPALKRTKRIASSNRSGSFVGSEFAFEDMLAFELSKYRYRWIRDESLEGIDCFLVERVPLYEGSGYTRQLVWYDRKHYRPMKIEYQDRKGALLKTLFYSNYRQYHGRFWRAENLKMVNHQSRKETLLEFQPYKFKAGLTDSHFEPSRLQKLR